VNILAIRLSALGDVLLTFPVLQGLKEKHPKAKLYILCKPEQVPLLRLLPFDVYPIVYKGSAFTMAKELRRMRFNRVVDFHNNLRTFLLQLFMLRFQWRRVKKMNGIKWRMTALKQQHLTVSSIVERYALAANIALPKERLSLNSNPPSASALPVKYVAWVLGAKFKTKQFPIAKIKEALAACSMPVVLLGGKEEQAISEEILHSFPKTLSLVGKTDFSEAAWVLSNAQLVVTNDTGLMHLAAFFNRPMLIIWGNTVPGFGMGPYGCTHVEHFEVRGLSCRPCSKIGYPTCPKGHFNCMQRQDTALLARRINALFHQETPESPE